MTHKRIAGTYKPFTISIWLLALCLPIAVVYSGSLFANGHVQLGIVVLYSAITILVCSKTLEFVQTELAFEITTYESLFHYLKEAYIDTWFEMLDYENTNILVFVRNSLACTAFLFLYISVIQYRIVLLSIACALVLN